MEKLFELRYDNGVINNIDLDDIIIVFHGNIIHVNTNDMSYENGVDILEKIKPLCQTFNGIKLAFFNDDWSPSDDLCDNEGNLLTQKVISRVKLVNNLPKTLFFVVDEDEDGLSLYCHNETNYNILNSKELNDFLKTDLSNYFVSFNINGKTYYKDELLNINKEKSKNDIVATLYQGTSQKFLPQILKNGIRQNSENSAWEISNKGIVFMTSSFNNAEVFSEIYSEKTQTNQCIIEIDAKKLNEDNFVLDYDISKEFSSDHEETNYFHQPSKRNIVGGVLKNSSRNGTKYVKVGYKGVVMPSAIKNIYIKEDGSWKQYSKEEALTLLNKELNNMNENVINEITSDEINLSSFSVKDELNPRFWINGKINSRVRLRLLDIANDFIDELSVRWVKPKDIVFTGSLANYNWSKYSDIDLHIIIDYSEVYENTDFVLDYFNSKKILWNQTHEDLTIYGFPVEVYVEDYNEPSRSSGVYSLKTNEWIKEPKDLSDARLNRDFIKEKSAHYVNMIEDYQDKFNDIKTIKEFDSLGNKAKKLFDKLKKTRKEGLKTKAGEMSSGNIIWKVLRRSGHLDTLYDIIDGTYNKSKTLS